MTKSTNFRVGTYFRVFLDTRSADRRWAVYDYRLGLIVAENFKTEHAARWWAKNHG